MILSIRKFLLINLLLAITITTTLTAIGNYYLDQRDIEQHLDTLMVIAALSYQALLGPDISQEKIHITQRSLDDLNIDLDRYYNNAYIAKNEQHYAHKFNFQVWDKTGKLLLHSPNAPKHPLSDIKEGFSDETIEGKRWRVFTAYDPENQTHTMIGEQHNTRRDLGVVIAFDDIYIMMLTFPLSGLLIWLIIGKGLSSLKTIAEQVSNRNRNNLNPVKMQKIPDEIRPVIEELNKLFKRLQEAFEREKRFAGDAAHELRTPLAVMKTKAQLALKASDPSQREMLLKDLIHGVNRSTHVMQQLLTMSRLAPEANEQKHNKSIDLNLCASEIIQQLIHSAIDKKIEIALINHAKNQSTFYGNETAILILIRNLIDNAIRYSDIGGKIYVIIDSNEKNISIAVKDNGPGIPKELHERIFERFFRVLGNKATGSGLGLSIVAQICHLHDATIALNDGIDGRGLEVKVTFRK